MTINYARVLAKQERKVRVIYISSYIPRECGIATFTKDLTTSINVLNPHSLAEIVAVNDPGQTYDYPWEVKFRFTQDDAESYRAAAAYINQSSAELVCLQHEFGLYHHNGDMIYENLIKLINKPIVTTFHAVPTKDLSSSYVLKTTKQIAAASEAIVVLAPVAAEQLIKLYEVDPSKIVVIPHGVPDMPMLQNGRGKTKLGLGRHMVLSTFGLLSPHKGIEYVIQALPEVVKRVPNILYVILGETHPVLKRKEGEKYRRSLQALVRTLGLQKNVIFDNRYLTKQELIQYLQASDMYITPYLGQDQVASGTLSYAVGAGLPCISTRYVYAVDLLDGDRGLLVDFANAPEIAQAIIRLAGDKELRMDIRQRAYLYGRQMTWDNVALKHLDLFSSVIEAKKS